MRPPGLPAAKVGPITPLLTNLLRLPERPEGERVAETIARIPPCAAIPIRGQVRVAPRANGNATVVNATVASVVSPSPLVVRWTASLPVNAGFSAVQVKVVRP